MGEYDAPPSFTGGYCAPLDPIFCDTGYLIWSPVSAQGTNNATPVSQAATASATAAGFFDSE